MRRINLIPPQIGERERANKQTVWLSAAYGGLVLVIAAVWFVLHLQLQDQRDRQAEAAATAETLTSEVNKLADFSQLENQIKSKGATLTKAMANDVGWAKLFKDLAQIVPGNSWLTAFAGATPYATQSATGIPASVSQSSVPQPGIPAQQPKLGTLTFTAVTYDFPGVAQWINTLEAQLPSVQNIFVPSAEKAQIGNREVVNYTSTADLSTTSASGRYKTQGGI